MTQGFTVCSMELNHQSYGDPVPMIFQLEKIRTASGEILIGCKNGQVMATAGAAIDSCYYKFCFRQGVRHNGWPTEFWKKFIPNTWQHLTLSYDGATSQFSVYINGVLYPERSKVLKNCNWPKCWYSYLYRSERW
jgi:hypothetical protein